jgi:acyl-CoA synthetase (AMP-forming)/AMP-acid ligase II
MPMPEHPVRTIPALVRSGAHRWPNHPAVVDGELRLTYAGLAEAMRRSARAAMAAGLEPGDRAAIWAPNAAEWIVAALGVIAAGGAVVPVNTRFKEQEAAHVLGTSRARLCFTVNGFLDIDYLGMLDAVRAGLPDLGDVVVLRGEAPPGTVSWDRYLEAARRVPDTRAEDAEQAITGADVSDVLFTSGTTGRPKGVMTTHTQNVSVYDVYTACIGLRHSDRYLVVNPFFHSFGFKAGWLSSILRGATVFPHPVFDAAAVLRRVEDERITVLPGPPTLLASILDCPDRAGYDTSSLRLTVTGAAFVPVELIRRLHTEMNFETVLSGYGLTETSGVVTVCHHGDDPETVANWSGRPIPGVEVQVVDDKGCPLPPYGKGEILVRGYNVMKGYLDDASATAAAIDPDGWLRTGDIGVMNEDGYLKVTDRKSDMFIVGGFNAYPAEIESILLEHEALAQVAVIGIPDARLGEVGMAYVVRRSGSTVTGDELAAWARAHMANYKVPRRIEIVDELVVNASGKVDKAALRAMVPSRPPTGT